MDSLFRVILRKIGVILRYRCNICMYSYNSSHNHTILDGLTVYRAIIYIEDQLDSWTQLNSWTSIRRMMDVNGLERRNLLDVPQIKTRGPLLICCHDGWIISFMLAFDLALILYRWNDNICTWTEDLDLCQITNKLWCHIEMEYVPLGYYSPPLKWTYGLTIIHIGRSEC